MDPALSPPPPRASIAPDAWGAPARTLERPGTVTYACVASIILGVLGAIGGLFVMMFSSLFSLIPVVGNAFATFGAMIGLFLVAMGVLGVVAGAQGLKGQSWARWTMVGLFGLGVVAGFTTLVVTAVCIAGIVCLVTKPANDWFDAHDRRSVPVG